MDLHQIILTVEGKALRLNNEKDAPDITLEYVLVEALMSDYSQREQNLEGPEKLTRYQLAMKIKDGKDDLTVEEWTLIKKLVGWRFSTLVVGQVYEAIESHNKKEDAK